MRLIARIFVFASSLFIILYGVLPGFLRVEGGFIPFYVAGRNLLKGINPILFYRFPDFQRLIDASGLSTRISSIGGSTPASFLVGALISILPAGFSQFILTAVNLGAFVLLVHVSAKLANSSVKTAYLVFLSSSFALATNFSSVEPFIILSLLFAAAFFASSTNAERAAGVTLAVVFPFELFTAIPALLFLLAKRWRLFIYFLLMTLFFLLITYLLIGETAVTYYLQRVFPLYFNGKVQNPFSISYQTAWSFFRRVFLFDQTLNPQPILASRNAYVFFISLFKAFVVVPPAYFFYRGIEKGTTREAFVASTFPIIFLSPTAATFQLVLLAPAIICLGQAALEEQRFTTGRLFIVLYALSCLPIYSFMYNFMNIRTPFLLYERFLVLLFIYILYLTFQLRLVPRHLLSIRLTLVATILSAVTVTLYIGDGTPEPSRTLPAFPILNGSQLRSASFSPAIHGDQMFFISPDSASQNYGIHFCGIREGTGSRVTDFVDLPGNCYHVSFDESGEHSAIETTDGTNDVVDFRSEIAAKSYLGGIGSVSRDGDFGAFMNDGRLFIVDLRTRQIPVVDSINILPFKITHYSFNREKDSSLSSVEIVVILIDSLNGANSIGTYDLSDHHLETHGTLFPVSLISADGRKIYMTYETNDSTSVWSQTPNESPVELFSVRGDIVDINAVHHYLFFSSDFERGLNLPTIYRYTLTE